MQEFVNTSAVEHGRELLESPETLRAWLSEHGLEPPTRISADDLERTHELREAIHGLLLTRQTGTESASAVVEAERLAAHAPLRVGFADLEPRLLPAGTGIAGVHGRLLAIVQEAALTGSWQRLKACRQCRWVFYDASKNRSASWCSMAICGNRRKTREYRRRRRVS